MKLDVKRKLFAGMIASLIFTFWFIQVQFNIEGFVLVYSLTSAIVLTYGLAISLLSDWLSRQITSNHWGQFVISALLHCAGGLILWYFGAIAAVVFFCIDRLAMRINIRWIHVYVLLGLSAVVWIYDLFKYYI